MAGIEDSVPPDWIGVDRPTSFGPVQPVRWTDTCGSAHADFGDHHKIAIYTEVADEAGGTVLYTALRHESTAGAAIHRAVWAEQRFANDWLVAAPVLPDAEGTPDVGAPWQIIRDEADRHPWEVGTYQPALPGPSRRLRESVSDEPAKALAYRGLRNLRDRWGNDLLKTHGFDPTRAVLPRRHLGGRPATPDCVVARVVAVVDRQRRIGGVRGAYVRALAALEEVDGEWWSYSQLKNVCRRARQIGYQTEDRTITAVGISALAERDRALLHPDALR